MDHSSNEKDSKPPIRIKTFSDLEELNRYLYRPKISRRGYSFSQDLKNGDPSFRSMEVERPGMSLLDKINLTIQFAEKLTTIVAKRIWHKKGGK